MGEGFQGECKVCGWTGKLHDDHGAAEEEAAEHAGYCSQIKVYHLKKECPRCHGTGKEPRLNHMDNSWTGDYYDHACAQCGGKKVVR